MGAASAPRPVLVTRPAGRGATLLELLHTAGIQAEHHPLIRLVPGADAELAAARALLAAGDCTHLVVTSRTVAELLAPVEVAPTVEIVAVGEGTAEALRTIGLTPDLVAAGSGADLVAQMPAAADAASVLFPASSAAARTVPEGLRAKGYLVRELTAYRPEPLDPPDDVRAGLAAGHYGALVLTSPMIARRAAALGVHPSTPIVSIGAPTSRAAKAAGLTVSRQAAETTDAALLTAVQEVLTPAPPTPHLFHPHSPSPKES
ncbi:uroporphyrinogen-III synthase [Brachybacterium avium]|uniref:Uroporphyrinogen-III synthase n=1 Tax=Brachybacterium avium TaxID=2017485 RepID=A0A220UBM1_9MICO|nr:uroporphyrinogen-III synthase [Brachybacterium avium]ASK65430.1 uroporphyrinogen-III synthase [Brachybacterium avium]